MRYGFENVLENRSTDPDQFTQSIRKVHLCLDIQRLSRPTGIARRAAEVSHRRGRGRGRGRWAAAVTRYVFFRIVSISLRRGLWGQS